MGHIKWEWELVMSHISMRHVAYECSKSHANESRHILNESRPSYQWVMSHMDTASCIRMSHVTYWMNHFTRINESRRIWILRVAYERVTSHIEWVTLHISMSHVAYECSESHTNGSRHIWMSHVTHINRSCRKRILRVAYEWVTSHMNESRHTYKQVPSCMNIPSRLWMRHITYERVMLHISTSHVTYK